MNEVFLSIGLLLISLPLFMKSKKSGKRTYVEIKDWLTKKQIKNSD